MNNNRKIARLALAAAWLLVVAFILLAPVSLLSMTHAMGHGSGCTASNLFQVDCPKNDAGSLLRLHADFYNLLTSFVLDAAIVFISLAIFAWLLWGRLKTLFDLLTRPRYGSHLFQPAIRSRDRFRAWLALKYLSPSR